MQAKFKPKTVHGVGTDVKALLDFLEQEGMVEADPFKRVTMPRLPKTILPAFESEEITKLLSVTAGRDELSIRNRAMILVLLDSGVRLNEMSSMKVGDVGLETGTFKVVGKVNKERICHTSPITCKIGLEARKLGKVRSFLPPVFFIPVPPASRSKTL